MNGIHAEPDKRGGVAPKERLMSLDALRGFDMFWIVGADALGHALAHWEGGPVTAFLANQLDHVAWEGFRFYDLIFPLFAFMIGVAITFSLGRLVEREGRGGAVKRVVRRALLLYALGIFYYGGFSTSVEHFRWVGVLQRLAFCYLGAGLLFIFLKPRSLAVVGGAILVGYWILLTVAPIRDVRLDTESLASRAVQMGRPEVAEALKRSVNVSTDKDRVPWRFAMEVYEGATNRVRGHYEPGYNLANHLDFRWLPGKKWDGFYDPEGLISNIPAVVSSLFGVLAGLWLRRTDRTPRQRVTGLAVGGAVAVLCGFAWGWQFPVIKKIWTSSYVLVAGGYSALLLALFYQIIDVWQARAWAQPFVWIGTNALTIYIISNVVNFGDLSSRLAGGDIARLLDAMMPGLGGVVLALVGAGLCFLVCRFLYRRGIFLRL